MRPTVLCRAAALLLACPFGCFFPIYSFETTLVSAELEESAGMHESLGALLESSRATARSDRVTVVALPARGLMGIAFPIEVTNAGDTPVVLSADNVELRTGADLITAGQIVDKRGFVVESYNSTQGEFMERDTSPRTQLGAAPIRIDAGQKSRLDLCFARRDPPDFLSLSFELQDEKGNMLSKYKFRYKRVE